MKTVNNINTELRNLYDVHYPELIKELIIANEKLENENNKTERGTNPLLLMVNENYVNAEIKIMFFGQETNFWQWKNNDDAFLGEIQPVIDLYKEFFIEERCYKYGGQFWNGINRFKKLINNNLQDKKIGFLWNNIVKIGKCGKGFPYKINSITNQYFNVIPEEIKITEPDVIIFMTGPYYDNEIKKILGEYNFAKIGSFSNRQLCKMEYSNFPIIIRTYHPNYLWRIGIDNYFNAIIEEIKS